VIGSRMLLLEEEPSSSPTPGLRAQAGANDPANAPPDFRALVASRALPILPTPDAVLFPLAIVPFTLDGPGLAMINTVMAGDRLLAVFTQRVVSPTALRADELYRVGTLAKVVRMARVSEDSAHILVQGLIRVRLESIETLEPIVTGRLEVLEDDLSKDVETEGLGRAVLDQFSKLVIMSSTLPDALVSIARGLQGAGAIADFVAATIEIPLSEKQALLDEPSVKKRLEALVRVLGHQLDVTEVSKKIEAQVRGSMAEQEKEFMLRQQLEAIRKELGDKGEGEREIALLRQRLERAALPEGVQKEADRELSRLMALPTQSPEHGVVRTYLEWLADMPWAISTHDNLDLANARAVLDEDHFGLRQIKERIIEYIAVRHFKKDARTPILCLAGPPGTGKTSLGRSIARALGRKFVRQSLGGVRDEAEIRGHRRTYIGAMPGAIIQGIRRAGSNNPLFMLDEIDKLGMDFRGDPASALLEVLDPEQNGSFVDHYLDVPFSLASTLFVCTANVLDPVPPALRDRMEVITLSGYTEQEKLQIALRHLIPRSIQESGLEALGIDLTQDAVLDVIREYTSEAGLRNLKRQIETLLRRTATLVAEGREAAPRIDVERVHELLGPPPYSFERVHSLDTAGAALGLAWTPAGGEVLVIEAAAMPGKKELLLTGKLGDVMKESALAALSYVRSHAARLGIDPKIFETTDLHVHVPSGAIAKDGPSAGVALCAALASLLAGRLPVPKIAMTGEITLHGRVLPVGGIKEKALAAHRAGLDAIVLPLANEKDLADIPEEVRAELRFLPVESIDQVLELVLLPRPPSTVAAPAAGATERALRSDAGAAQAPSPGISARG
jgi:ATP-dependent Lon protease